jgi:hypothetical protein
MAGKGEDSRESWARATAHHIVDGALSASERSGRSLPSPDQIALLREIARRALWHMWASMRTQCIMQLRRSNTVNLPTNIRRPHIHILTNNDQT